MSDDKDPNAAFEVEAPTTYVKDPDAALEAMIEKKKDHRLVISENPFKPSPEDKLTLLYRKLGLTPEEVHEEYEKIKNKESRLSSDMRKRLVLFVEQVLPQYK